MATEYWVNNDGLTISFGQIDVLKNVPAVVNTEAYGDTMVAEVDAITLPDAGVPTQYENGAYIPAGALIESVQLVVSDAFTSGGAAVLDVGVYDEDGVAVDDDGLVAAQAVAGLTAGAVIAGAGALVGTVASQNLYVALTYDTAAFTAGSGRLVIKYSK